VCFDAYIPSHFNMRVWAIPKDKARSNMFVGYKTENSITTLNAVTSRHVRSCMSRWPRDKQIQAGLGWFVVTDWETLAVKNMIRLDLISIKLEK
jgi:hypothetical protein